MYIVEIPLVSCCNQFRVKRWRRGSLIPRLNIHPESDAKGLVESFLPLAPASNVPCRCKRKIFRVVQTLCLVTCTGQKIYLRGDEFKALFALESSRRFATHSRWQNVFWLRHFKHSKVLKNIEIFRVRESFIKIDFLVYFQRI